MAWTGGRDDRGGVACRGLAERVVLFGSAVEDFNCGRERLGRGDDWRTKYQSVAAWFWVKLKGVNDQGAGQKTNGRNMFKGKNLRGVVDSSGQERDAARCDKGACPGL